MWERAADLIGVTVAQVQSWICAGQLRVVDTFVTDRSFEEFCKKHGGEINTTLMDPATAKWLVKRVRRARLRIQGSCGFSRSKARVDDQNVQVWKENSWQRLFQAHQVLQCRDRRGKA